MLKDTERVKSAAEEIIPLSEENWKLVDEMVQHLLAVQMMKEALGIGKAH